ncbi:MAG: aerolysin family beta-barrel pore-forming toxin [Muribaculaceae bacterium]|nr:aerolysin family beta-barrel pore-forming toxin [Muribaculaceae bacterium]
MKKFSIILSLIAICSQFLPACSDESSILKSDMGLQEYLSDTYFTGTPMPYGFDEILPLEGDSLTMRKKQVKTRALSTYSELYEELKQLDQIPIYLQIKGNTSTKHFLNSNGEGMELTFENYKDNNISQQFYIKTLPAATGIPYMIYSKQTNTPISLGSYSNAPNIKVVYVKPSGNTSTFGASWDIRYGEYSNESFIIENQDYPRQGSSGSSYDIYYSVISANDSKVSLDKYLKLPKQEFSIIPVENFKVESLTFNTDIATLSYIPNKIFSDKFTNKGPIDQNHTFTISDSYRETSSFNRRTTYNVNVTTKFKVKVPFIVNGEISTSISEGQDFTYGETEENTVTINRSYPIIVPANYVAQMTLTLTRYTMDVEYCAVCVGLTSGRKIKIKGTWNGVDVQESDAYLELTPINGTKSNIKLIRISDEMLTNANEYIKVE